MCSKAALLCAGACAALLLSLSAARAAENPVALYGYQGPDDGLATTIESEVRRELEAAGFRVTADTAHVTRTLGNGGAPAFPAGANAAVRVTRTGDGVQIDAWLVDTASGERYARRLALADAAATDARAIAAKVAEALQDCLSQALTGEPAPPEPEPEPIAAPMAAPAPPVEKGDPSALDGWSFAAGGRAVFGTQKVGPTLGPVFHVGRQLSDRFVGRLALAWPSTTPDLEGVYGRAALTAHAAWAELATIRPTEGLLEPYIMVGAGVHRLEVEGVARPPFTAQSRTMWSGLATVGFGIAARFTRHVALAAEGQVQVLLPQPEIRLNETSGAVGTPGLVLHLSLVVHGFGAGR